MLACFSLLAVLTGPSSVMQSDLTPDSSNVVAAVDEIGLLMRPVESACTDGASLRLRPLLPGTHGEYLDPVASYSDGREYQEVEYDGLLEWARRAGASLEHGFVIRSLECPSLTISGDGIRLDLKLPEDFRALVHDSRAVLFESPSGTYTYSGLDVWDSTGRELDARFEPTEDARVFTLRILTSEAALPIVIDPMVLFESEVVTSPSPTSGAQFGASVAADGTTMIVGAPSGGNGTADVYVFDGTSWVHQQALQAPSSVNNDDEFGASVAVVGDLAAVGAPRGDKPGSPNSGALSIYSRTGTTWSAPVTFFPAVIPGDAGIGVSVSIDSSQLRVATGAALGTGMQTGSGVVHLYSGSPLAYETTLIASDGMTGDQFGCSVSVSGDTVAVGADMVDDNGNASGAVYIYQLQGTTWTETDKLFAADLDAAYVFGGAVSLSGDRLVVGSRGADVQFTCQPGGVSGCNEGAAYVFERSGTVWSETAKLVASDGFSGAALGFSVSIQGDTVLVGARDKTLNTMSLNQAGSAYEFQLVSGSWIERGRLSSSATQDAEHLGEAVAIAADHFLVGAPGHTAGAVATAGSVYSYARPSNLMEFCFGDGGTIRGTGSPGPTGCTPCPCGNDAGFGTYGGCRNSAGRFARLRASGTPSVSADSLHFDLFGCTSMATAVLSSGDNALPTLMSNPCLGQSSGVQSMAFDGLRCIGGFTQRHGARTTDGNGDVSLPAGWGPPSGPSGGIAAQGGFSSGQTRQFQVTYREDVTLGCLTGLNTSTAVSVTFGP